MKLTSQAYTVVRVRRLLAARPDKILARSVEGQELLNERNADHAKAHDHDLSSSFPWQMRLAATGLAGSACAAGTAATAGNAIHPAADAACSASSSGCGGHVRFCNWGDSWVLASRPSVRVL